MEKVENGQIACPLLICDFISVIDKAKVKSEFYPSLLPIIITEDHIYRLFFIVFQ